MPLISEVSQAQKTNTIQFHLSEEPNKTNKQTNEQNRTRDMEIKNKLTVTRGEGGSGGKKGMGQVKENE